MECMACGVVVPAELILWHQRVCPELPAEKRKVREQMLRIQYGVAFSKAMELVQSLPGYK